MTPPVLVSAEKLSCHFARPGLWRRGAPVQAVTEFSLTIRKGAAVGLVGESGSGKTTVGRLLLGLLAPTAGRVVFDGIDLAARSAEALRRLRPRMQLVFQDPYGSLDPRRAVGAQIADPLDIHALMPPAARPARVAELLAQVGLAPEHARRLPHAFSGGQRQRIGIARALASSPDLLVADEPVSALDVSVQAQVLTLLTDLRARLGLTMLFISHDLPVVRHLCDTVVVMYLGQVMESGPAARIFAAPRHPYTRALLSAAPAMHPDRRRARILLQGEPPSPAAPPSGCVFRTRCPHALQQCAEAVPALRGEGEHLSACVRDDLR